MTTPPILPKRQGRRDGTRVVGISLRLTPAEEFIVDTAERRLKEAGRIATRSDFIRLAISSLLEVEQGLLPTVNQ
jgi:hypothetical protein